MSELLERKVGIVSCSGEELAEGTVSRLAALKVLNELRPRDTVTICLPLFLAGGRGGPGLRQAAPHDYGGRLRLAVRGARRLRSIRASPPPAWSSMNWWPKPDWSGRKAGGG